MKETYWRGALLGVMVAAATTITLPELSFWTVFPRTLALVYGGMLFESIIRRGRREE